MNILTVTGPSILSGSVSIQGSKNAAMKHVLMPLLAPGIWTFHNIPRIGSVDNLLSIIEFQGATVSWASSNTVVIDSTSVAHSQPIPSNLFHYTSGAIFVLNILTHRFGHCTLERNLARTDTGGDQIGSRELSTVFKTFEQLGISTRESSTTFELNLHSDQPFVIDVPVRSFSVSVNAVIAALFKTGTSVINSPTLEPDFYDTIRFLRQAGAQIAIANDSITVQGPCLLQPTEFTNMYDRHDFVTFFTAALITNSQLTITNVDFSTLGLDALTAVTDRMNIKLVFENNTCHIPAQLETIKPTSIRAGLYPNFITEWQVLFAPLLSQLNGNSQVLETVFTNRMQHYIELGKMGVKYKFFTHPDCPEKDNNPRAVAVTGPTKLIGTDVCAKDVRTGGALIITALAAQGITTIHNYDDIARGYENIVDRLRSVGVNTELN